MVSSSQNAAIDAWVLDRQFWGSGINPLSSAETLSSALVQQGLARLGRMTAFEERAWIWQPKLRRVYAFLLTQSARMSAMEIEGPTDQQRVAVLIRMQTANRDGLRSRVASEHASINRYVEHLVRRDLDAPEGHPFVPISTPRFASKGKNGIGRPTKGSRAAVKLRCATALRDRIHQRADSLGLTVNDYLESLVSHDISAATPAGEEMAFDQTA